ncbi:MAG: hypothetical protein O3B13_25925, partial [Planctomycetota bacterium]|nr:hypothetical protein [Planctomycetota bacterium]
WQPSRCQVKAGVTYEYAATGTWQVDEGSELVDADGAEDGSGRLVGAIFDAREYELSEAFELGAYGTLTPEVSGELVLRCNDEWREIDDGNSGQVSVLMKLQGSGEPLPDPRQKTRD